MTARTLPGILSTRCLNVSGRMAADSSYRAVSDVGRWGLEQSRHSKSSHKWSVVFRSLLWSGEPISGTLLSTNHSLRDLIVWQGALSCCYKQLSSPSSVQLVSTVEWSELVGEHSVRGLLGFSPCELLLLEARSWGMVIVQDPRVRGNVCHWKPLLGDDWWRHSRLRRYDLKVCDDGTLVQILRFLTSIILSLFIMSSCFSFKHNISELDSVSVFR
jgi:hypothetical protein